MLLIRVLFGTFIFWGHIKKLAGYSQSLKFRNPLHLFWPRAIYKGNICVDGNALHAITPVMGQGGCAALEDAVILTRCLADVFLNKDRTNKVDEDT